MADLMAYASIIAKASQKYRWPSWIVYDQNFRQEAADMQNKQWAKVDPGLGLASHYKEAAAKDSGQ